MEWTDARARLALSLRGPLKDAAQGYLDARQDIPLDPSKGKAYAQGWAAGDAENTIAIHATEEGPNVGPEHPLGG